MKPEQLEIERLRREVAKLRAERDILKTIADRFRLWGRNGLGAILLLEGSGRRLFGGV